MTVPPWIWGVVDLWLLCRSHGSLLAGRPLPGPGGPGSQPAGLLDAFTILDGVPDGK